MCVSSQFFCLQNCDLTGCELQHANLRGSNLTGAILKEIPPLHMSQTVNVTTVSIQANGSQQHQHQQPQGQGPAVGAPGQPQQPNVLQHHQQPNQPGASPPHMPGGEGDIQGDQHIGNTQEQAQHHANT